MTPACRYQDHIGKLCNGISSNFNAEIDAATMIIAESLYNRRMVAVCGNGGSAADAQHFAAELTGRMSKERESHPCVVLGSNYAAVTAIANDYGSDAIFSRELSGYHNCHALIVFSTSMKSPNIVSVVNQAKFLRIPVIAFTGSNMPIEGVHYIHATCETTPAIQEAHGIMLHILVEKIEEYIYEMGSAGST